MFSAMIYVCSKICKYSSHRRHSKWDNEERREVPSFSPTDSEGPDQAFFFSQVVLSRLDPIAKTSLFFFLFFKNK